MPVGAQRGDGRPDDRGLLVAQRALLAGMRIEPGNGETWPRDAEVALQCVAVVCAAATMASVVSMAIELRSEACTVTGTTRSSGLASIMICLPCAPVSAARNSVWPG